MMATVAFDTLAYSNMLQDGGIPREQAETLARANASALERMIETRELATRMDLELALANTKKDLELAIAQAKHETLKWVIGLAAAQMAVAIAIAGIVIAILKQ